MAARFFPPFRARTSTGRLSVAALQKFHLHRLTMTTRPVEAELGSLIEQSREHLKYLEELGVTGFVPQPAESGSSTRKAPEAAASNAGLSTKSQSFFSAATMRREPAAVTPTQAAQSVPNAPQDSLFGDLLPTQTPPTITQSEETLEEIWADIGDCMRCPLYEGRTNIVHTEGSRKARLMFVGEAPGADEDAQSRPFVGRAGQLLTKIIESLGLKREEVLIGNINRCRPPGNRAPTPDEAAACKPFLLREIASVAPEVIVVLGNTAMKNLLEVKEGITRLRGIFQDYKGVKVMPTFHPAYLLRDPSKKRETWEDLKKVRDYLESSKKDS